MAATEIKYFIGYARDDVEFTLKLARALRTAGADLWLDKLDIQPGAQWDRAVEDALEACQGMIVILSPASVASDNVKDELAYALDMKKRVIPVLYQDCKIPFRLRRRQRIDFGADYEAGLNRLLHALGLYGLSYSDASWSALNPDDVDTTRTKTSSSRKSADYDKTQLLKNVSHQASISSLPTQTGDSEYATPSQKKDAPQHHLTHTTLRTRVYGASAGAIVGGGLGMTGILLSTHTELWLVGILIGGLAGMIAGAICGGDWRVIGIAMLGILVGLVVAMLIGWAFERSSDTIIRDVVGVLIGGPLGAILGALGGTWLKKYYRWAKPPVDTAVDDSLMIENLFGK